MKIKWLGHSTFQIKSKSTLVIDPHNPEAGGKLPDDLTAETVLVTHDHIDHNFTQAVRGMPEIFRQLGEFDAAEYKIKGIASYHDNTNGSQRGENIIYTISAEGLKICHMGDLGHVLSDNQVDEIGKVDVLMIPVGGYYTIDADQATQVVNQLGPKVVLPMHYKPEGSDIIYNITGVEPFCEKLGWDVKSHTEELDITSDNLLDYENKIILFTKGI